MNRFHQPRVAAAIATASAAAAASLYTSLREECSVLETKQSQRDGVVHRGDKVDAPSRSLHHKYAVSQSYASGLLLASKSFARCEAMSNNMTAASTGTAAVDCKHSNISSDESNIDYYYMKMEPDDVERTSLLDSHAVFGALSGEGLIERYNVYKRINLHENNNLQQNESKREMVLVDLKLGHKLNGHASIAHGGILSLLFDEGMGWAYESLQEQDDTIDANKVVAVTANLNVDFRAPFMAGSEGVIRVYHDEANGRKIYFSAVLESKDGSIVYAQAKSLFILVRSDRLKSI